MADPFAKPVTDATIAAIVDLITGPEFDELPDHDLTIEIDGDSWLQGRCLCLEWESSVTLSEQVIHGEYLDHAELHP